MQGAVRSGGGLLVHGGGVPRTGAHIATTARLGRAVIQLLGQELHAALGGELVIHHGLLLGNARAADTVVPRGVVLPRPARGLPAGPCSR